MKSKPNKKKKPVLAKKNQKESQARKSDSGKPAGRQRMNKSIPGKTAKKPLPKKSKSRASSINKIKIKKTKVKKAVKKQVVKRSLLKKTAKKPAAKKPVKKTLKQNPVFTPEKTEALVKKGRIRGFITYSEILSLFPDIERDPKGLERFYEQLDNCGVEVKEAREFLETDESKKPKITAWLKKRL